jgi:diguanylate cyclase (GGDEF)-like protein
MFATADTPSSRPLDPGGLAARIAPFTGALLLAFAFLNLNHDGESPNRVLIAAGVAAVLVLAIGAAPWRSLPGWTQTVPPLAFFLLVAVLIDADGGSSSSFAPLALLPVLWLALYGTRGQLLAGILGAFAVFLVPMVFLGAPNYPPSDWLAPTMWMVNAAVVGMVVHELVREVRSRAIQVENLASSDKLTSLPSRTAWDERLPQELSRAHREKWQVSIALFVVDGLDDVRAEQGSEAADGLLRQTAFSWALELRGTDVLARYADDAFIAAFPGCSLGPGTELAERLQSLARGLSFSGGVACWDGAETPSILVSRVTAAASDAGQAGGNTIVQAVTR